jgi:hypothetical protein
MTKEASDALNGLAADFAKFANAVGKSCSYHRPTIEFSSVPDARFSGPHWEIREHSGSRKFDYASGHEKAEFSLALDEIEAKTLKLLSDFGPGLLRIAALIQAPLRLRVDHKYGLLSKNDEERVSGYIHLSFIEWAMPGSAFTEGERKSVSRSNLAILAATGDFLLDFEKSFLEPREKAGWKIGVRNKRGGTTVLPAEFPAASDEEAAVLAAVWWKAVAAISSMRKLRSSIEVPKTGELPPIVETIRSTPTSYQAFRAAADAAERLRRIKV